MKLNFVFCLLLVLSSEKIQAQNFIVSNLNIGTENALEGSWFDNWRAASFTTGLAPFTIDRVVVPLFWRSLDQIVDDESHFISIYNNSAEGLPGTELGKLLYPLETAPATALYYLRPPDQWSGSGFHSGEDGERIDLKANTTYWLVFGDSEDSMSSSINFDQFTIGTTDSAAETGNAELIRQTGAWSILDSHLHSTDQGSTWAVQQNALRFGITVDPIVVSTGNVSDAIVNPTVPILPNIWWATSFTTDDSAVLFQLDRLETRSTETWGTTQAAGHFISIYDNDPGGMPGEQIGDFGNHNNLGDQRFAFTPDGEIRLQPDTTYWVVFGNRSDTNSNYFIADTTAAAEGPWEIGNARFASTDGGMTWASSGNQLQIQITATLIPEPRSTFIAVLLVFMGMIRRCRIGKVSFKFLKMQK